MNNILSTFCHFSGKKVNRNKSQMFLSTNVLDELARDLCNDLGFVCMEDFGTYIDMPLFHKRVARSTFDFLIAKVRNKLNGWEAIKLSMVGRITLVKSILLTILNYFMSTARILISMCRKITKLACSFI